MSIIKQIQPFIFSWKGQYENAKRLESQLSEIFDNVVVINSDDDNVPDNWINIGNECYFSDQFRKALEVFNQGDYEFLWHIQADASFDNFEDIVKSADKAYDEYKFGVYAPNVDDTFYVSGKTDVFPLENNLKVVATTDNTCWIFHRDMANDMIDNLDLMKENQLGWGWDLLICAFSHLRRRMVIRDYNYTISHPASTGYKKEQAETEMQTMFNKCNDDLKRVIYFIKANPIVLSELYNIKPPQNNIKDQIYIYDTEAAVR